MDNITDIGREKILAEIIVERNGLIERLSNDIVHLCKNNEQLNAKLISVTEQKNTLVKQLEEKNEVIENLIKEKK